MKMVLARRTTQKDVPRCSWPVNKPMVTLAPVDATHSEILERRIDPRVARELLRLGLMLGKSFAEQSESVDQVFSHWE